MLFDAKPNREMSIADFQKAFLERPQALEIIDVRERGEFAEIRIRGSKNLPLSGLSGDTEEIDWDKEVLFVCRSGSRSLRVTYAFADLKKNGKNLTGGIAGLAEKFPGCLEG